MMLYDNFLFEVISKTHDSDEYYLKLQEIASNPNNSAEFCQSIIRSLTYINRNNIFSFLTILNDYLECEGNLSSIFDELLNLMFKEFNRDASIPRKYVEILLKINFNKLTIINELIRRTISSDLIVSEICLYALYGPLYPLSQYSNDVVEQLINNILKCFKKNKDEEYLHKCILYFLLPALDTDEIIVYKKLFIDEGLKTEF